MLKTHSLKYLLVILLCAGNFAPTSAAFDGVFDRDVRVSFEIDTDGRMIISKNYDYNKKCVAISMEWKPTYEQVVFQNILAQELMANGFTVVERLQFEEVLRELALDQTGAVNNKGQAVKEKISDGSASKENLAKREYSKNDLKKWGNFLAYPM